MSRPRSRKPRRPQGQVAGERARLEARARRARREALAQLEEPPPVERLDWVGRLG